MCINIDQWCTCWTMIELLTNHNLIFKVRCGTQSFMLGANQQPWYLAKNCWVATSMKLWKPNQSCISSSHYLKKFLNLPYRIILMKILLQIFLYDKVRKCVVKRIKCVIKRINWLKAYIEIFKKMISTFLNIICIYMLMSCMYSGTQ